MSEPLLFCFYRAPLGRPFYRASLGRPFYRASLGRPFYRASLGRPFARSICFSFLLCMEPNALEKSTNKSIALRFFRHTPMIWWIIRIREVVDRFHWKPSSFSENFFNIRSYIMKKQSIINLSQKSYASAVLCDFKATILEEGKDTAFDLFLYCVLFKHTCLPYIRRYSVKASSLSKFFWAASGSSSIKWKSLVV